MSSVAKQKIIVSVVIFFLACGISGCYAQSSQDGNVDYSRMINIQRLEYMAILISVVLVALVIVLYLLAKNLRLRKHFQNQAITFSTMYNASPDLLFAMDKDCRFTSCNPAWEAITGLTESEIIGKTSLEIFANFPDPKMAQGFMEANRKVINEKKAITQEEFFTRTDNTRVLLKTSRTPLIQNGKLIGILGVSRDITEYKTAEEAAHAASRAKSDFLAKMSHEIRTPMNAIVGMTELALRADDLDSAHEHIVTVKQASANLLSIINDILDFSKIETGKFEIVPGDYHFSSMLNDVINIIRMRVIDIPVRFVVNIDSKIPDALFGDEIRVRQVLLNILSNAVKYTEKGFVSFTAYGELSGEDSVILTLEVMDSGKGIKQEYMENLFGEYMQFDLASNKGTEGTGLGLAITNSIVRAMGGKIDVYSEYGKGSTFTVTLPQKVRSQAPLAAVDNPGDKDVIIYERREIFANSIVMTIDNLGVNCSVVSSNSELRERMLNHKFSFIFISFTLYTENRETILELGAKTQIVILTEFGETIPDKKLNVIAMPTHSMSIANILNGQSDNFSYNDSNELIVRFSAPDTNILVVDDVITNLNVAKGLLMPYKTQVALCKSGMMALRALKNSRFDLIFMDHRMPEMDGIETTRHIREMGGEDQYYKNVPIIALTADAVSGTKEMFLEHGFNDFLSKPIDTIRLDAVLEKWIPKEKQHGSVKK